MDNDPEPIKEQKKEKPLNELLTSAIVDIYVGPESTHWPIHERLICYHSPFMSNVFYKEHDKNSDNNSNKTSSRKNKSYGFPDEEDYTFVLLVGWLYSRVVPPPKAEKDISGLLDLYLLSQKLEMERLSSDVVDATREYYHTTNTYPGLRRVQYIYANTDEDNDMREMMVSSVARQLATTQKIPVHWATALQRNGQLAVDIIRAIQQWNIEERSIPDIRDSSISSGRGRKGKGGFSAIVRDGDSLDTEATGMTGSISLGSNLGVESLASEDGGHMQDKTKRETNKTARSMSQSSKEVEGEAEYLTLSSLSLLQAQLIRPPEDYRLSDTTSTDLPRRPQRRRRSSVTFKEEAEIMPDLPRNSSGEDTLQEQNEEDQDQSDDSNQNLVDRFDTGLNFAFQRREVIFLVFLWVVYVAYFLRWRTGAIWNPQSDGH